MAENTAPACEMDDVPDGEKIRLVIELFDQSEFMFQEALDLVGGPVGVAPFHALISQAFEPLGGGFIRRDFAGVFVAKLAEVEMAVLSKLSSAVDCGLVSAKQVAHVGLGPQALFSVRERLRAQFVDATAFADGGDHIRHAAATAMVHDGGRGGDGGQA